METPNIYNSKIVSAASSVWNDAAAQQYFWNLFVDTINYIPNRNHL